MWHSLNVSGRLRKTIFYARVPIGRLRSSKVIDFGTIETVYATSH